MKDLNDSQISTGRHLHLYENRSDAGETSTENTQGLAQRNLEGPVDFETYPSLLSVGSQATGSRATRARENLVEIRCDTNDVQKMAVKGHQILQVVDDLLEQAISLKGQLNEIVRFFETRSCEDCSQPYATEPDCRKNPAAAGSRMRSSSIDKRSDLANRESGRNKYKPESSQFNRSRQRESQYSIDIEPREQRCSSRLVADSRDTGRRASSGGREDLIPYVYDNIIRLRGGQTASTLDGSQAYFDTESVSSRLQQIQDEIVELKREVARLTTMSGHNLPLCKCRARYRQDINGGLDLLAKIVSTNLLEKTEEIKEMLKEIKSDCYGKLGSLAAGHSNIGGMKVRENQHRSAERTFPSYSKTITQTKNIKGEKTYQENMELTKTDQTYETKIDIKPKDGQRPRDILFSVRKKKDETVQNRKEKDERRQTVKETEKVAKSGDRTITEVDRINEDFAKYPEQAVTEIKRKVTRTQIEMGQDPKKEVVVNVKIHRTVDNKTGKVSETVNELRGESIKESSSIKSSGVSVKRVEPMKNVDRIASGRDVIPPDLSIKPLDRMNPLLYNTMQQQVEDDAHRKVYSATSSNQEVLRSMLSKSKRSDVATYFEIVDENNEAKSLSDKCSRLYGENRDEIQYSSPIRSDDRIVRATEPIPDLRSPPPVEPQPKFDQISTRASRQRPLQSISAELLKQTPKAGQSSRRFSYHEGDGEKSHYTKPPRKISRDSINASKSREARLSPEELRGLETRRDRSTLQSKSAESLKQSPKGGKSSRRFSYQEGDDEKTHYSQPPRKISRDSIKASKSRGSGLSPEEVRGLEARRDRSTLQSKSAESLKQSPKGGKSSRRFSYQEGDDEKTHYSQPPRKISRDSIKASKSRGPSLSPEEVRGLETRRDRSTLQSKSAESLKQSPKGGKSSRRFSYQEGDDEKTHYSQPPRKISRDSIKASKSRGPSLSPEEVRGLETRRDRSTLQSKSAESLKQSPKGSKSARRFSYQEGDDEKTHYSQPPRKISRDSVKASKSRGSGLSPEEVRGLETRRDRSTLQSKSAESLKQSPKGGRSSRRFSYQEGDDEKTHYSQPPRKISRDSIKASKSRGPRLSPEEVRGLETRRDRSALQSKSAESLKQSPKGGQPSRRFSYQEGDDEKTHYGQPPRKISRDSIKTSESRQSRLSPDELKGLETRRDRSTLQSKSAESLKQSPKGGRSSRRFSYQEGDDEKTHYSQPPRKISRDSIKASKSRGSGLSPEEVRALETRRDRSTLQSKSAESLKQSPKGGRPSRRFSYQEGDDEKTHYSQPPRKISRDSIKASKSRGSRLSPEEVRGLDTRRDRSTLQSKSAESLKQSRKGDKPSRRFSYQDGDDERAHYSQPPRKISRESIKTSESRESRLSPEEAKGLETRRDRSTLQSKSAESLKQSPKGGKSSRRFSYQEGDDEKTHYSQPPRNISRDSIKASKSRGSRLSSEEVRGLETRRDRSTLQSKSTESLKQSRKGDKPSRRFSYQEGDDEKTHYSQPPRKISRESIKTSESRESRLSPEEVKGLKTRRDRSTLQSKSAESLKQSPKGGKSSRRFSYQEGDDEKTHYSQPPRKISRDSIKASKSRGSTLSPEEVRGLETRRDRSTLQSKSAESLKQSPKGDKPSRRFSYQEGDDEKTHYSQPPRKISRESIKSSESRLSPEEVRGLETRRDRSTLQSKSAESLKQTPKGGKSSRRFSYQEGDDEKTHYSQPPRKISRDSIKASKSRGSRLSPEEVRGLETRRDRSTLESKSAESLKQSPKGDKPSRRFSYQEGDDEKTHYSQPPRKISRESIKSSESRESRLSPEEVRGLETRRDRSTLQSKSAESLKQSPKGGKPSRRFSYQEGDDEKTHYSQPPRKISRDSIKASKSRGSGLSPEEIRGLETRRDRSTLQSKSAESLKQSPKGDKPSRRFSYQEGDDEKTHYSQPPRKISRESIKTSDSRESRLSPEEVKGLEARRDRSTLQSKSAESLKQSPKGDKPSRRFSYQEGDDEKTHYSQPPRKISRESIKTSDSRESRLSPEEVKGLEARRDRSTLQSKSAESLKQTPKTAQSSRRFSYHEGDDERSHYTEPPRKISRDSTIPKELSASKLKEPGLPTVEGPSPFDQLSRLTRYVGDKVPEIPIDPLALPSKIAESLKQAPKIVEKLYHEEDDSKKDEQATRPRHSSGSSHSRQERQDEHFTYVDDAAYFYSVGSKILPLSDSKLDSICAERARRRRAMENYQTSEAVPQSVKYGRSRIPRRDYPATESVHSRNQAGEISETQEEYEEQYELDEPTGMRGAARSGRYRPGVEDTSDLRYNDERQYFEPVEYRRRDASDLSEFRAVDERQTMNYRQSESRRADLTRVSDYGNGSEQRVSKSDDYQQNRAVERDDGRQIPESVESRGIVAGKNGRTSNSNEGLRTVRNSGFSNDNKSHYRRYENAGSEFRKSKDILTLRESILEDINETEDQEMPKLTKPLPKSRDEWHFKNDANNTKIDESKSIQSSDTDEKFQNSQFLLMHNLQERESNLAAHHSKVHFVIPSQAISSVRPRDTSRNGSVLVMGGNGLSDEAKRSSSGREATTAASAATTTAELNQDSIISVEVQNMHKIIEELSGRRSPNEFFVSVLPEMALSKTFRVNIIDKETGDLLGFFYVNEDNFQSARKNGIFDNYLALYVLNSIGSISDVRDGLQINRKKFRRYQCFEQCSCKKK